MAVVTIPLGLLALTDGRRAVDVAARDVRGALAEIERLYPGVERRIRDRDGGLLRHVNVFVNGRNIRQLDGEASVLAEDDEIVILPAVSGG